MSTVDYATLARMALSAATTADDPATVVYYLASARVAFTAAKEELAAIEHILLAREREAAA